jgi:hypothetical protein
MLSNTPVGRGSSARPRPAVPDGDARRRTRGFFMAASSSASSDDGSDAGRVRSELSTTRPSISEGDELGGLPVMRQPAQLAPPIGHRSPIALTICVARALPPGTRRARRGVLMPIFFASLPDPAGPARFWLVRRIFGRHWRQHERWTHRFPCLLF